MITYQKRISLNWIWAGAGLAVVLGLAWALGAFDAASDAIALPADSAASQSSALPVVASGASQMERAQAVLTEPEVLPDGRPSDIDAEEWAMLKQATVDHPNPKAELERLTKFLRFQRGVEAWQAMSGQSDTAERDKLGQKLIETLPMHLVNAEVSMPEALMLCAAILHGDRGGEDPVVSQKVEQCKTRLEQSLPPPDKEKLRREEACKSDWDARKTALTADFLKKSPQERAAEQRQFEADLEAARVEIYSSAGCDGSF